MPYIYFESYKNTLNTVRKYYPTSDIFIYFDSFRDDIEKYREVANEYDCKFIIKETHVFYTDRNDTIQTNLPKLIEVFNRIKNTCENTQAEWILILEDDVVVKRKIETYPISDVGTCRSYFRPGGGSIFKRKAFLDAFKNNDIKNIIEIIPNAYWAADVILENMFIINNNTFEEWLELAEPNYRDNDNHAIFHGYKELYKLG